MSAGIVEGYCMKIFDRRWARALGAVLAGAALTAVAAGPAAAATVSQISAGETSSLGAVWLPDASGARHLWVSDHLNGVCRLDPVGGTLAINQSSCVLFVGRGALKPGQLAYDPATRYLYVPDLSSKSVGVVRLKYNPAGDNGQGGIDLFDRTVLVANCGVGGNLPWGAALGPDGDLYLAFKKGPNLLRVVQPGLAGPTSTSCGAAVQQIGTAADGKKAFQLAFVGHDLWEIDGLAMGVVPDAVAKARPTGTVINDGGTVRTFTAATSPQNAVSVFVGSIAVPSALAASGSVLYVGNATSVYAVDLSRGGSLSLVSGGFTFVTGLAVEPGTATATLTVADDPSNGAFTGVGRVWRLAL